MFLSLSFGLLLRCSQVLTLWVASMTGQIHSWISWNRLLSIFLLVLGLLFRPRFCSSMATNLDFSQHLSRWWNFDTAHSGTIQGPSFCFWAAARAFPSRLSACRFLLHFHLFRLWLVKLPSWDLSSHRSGCYNYQLYRSARLPVRSYLCYFPCTFWQGSRGVVGALRDL